MAVKQEMYTLTIDLNFNSVHEKFRNEVLRHIDNHNVWFKETLDAIEQKAKNPQCVSVSEIHVKTPRQRKRKTVLTTAKKLLESGTINKKKKRRTLRPSAVKRDSSSSGTDCKENDDKEIEQQAVSRELFEDLDACPSKIDMSPIESKWKMKQYTRASRATFRETLIKANQQDCADDVPKPEIRRVTRSMRQTIYKQKSDGSSSEKTKNDMAAIANEEMIETDVDEKLPSSDLTSPLKLKNQSASTPKTSVEVIDIVEKSPEQFVTPKANRKESDNEWLTDDESFHEVQSTPQPAKKIVPANKKLSMNRGSSQTATRTLIPTTTRMTRAQTRLQAQSANRDKIVTRTMQKNIIASGGSGNSSASESSSKNYGSTAKSMRSVSRLKTQGSAVKGLTESAAKRREDERQRRMILLQKSVEKESRVLEKKEKFIQQRVMEHKMKREEKQKRVQQLREQQEKEKEEKRRLELERKEEIEKRYKQREESKKARLAERQQVLAAKMAETEQRKLREEKERQEKLQKMEESNRKKEEEIVKRKQEEERLAALCQQHNNSLQQKAMANSYLKKTVDLPPPKISPPTKAVMDKTYIKDSDASTSQVDCDGYQLTPPPKPIKKPPNPEDYDITDIKSDDDTDDERKPKKPIPSWAKGSQFIQALSEQFGKPVKYRERTIRKLFKSVVLPVDLGDIFQGHRPVATRYAKRTSSAIWASPPLKHANMSVSFSTDSSHLFSE